MNYFSIPNNQKYTKLHKIKFKQHKEYKNKLFFGAFGLCAIEEGYINSKQLEAAKKVISKYIKKLSKLYIRIYPNFSLTAKPAETRMGKGKGNPIMWVNAINVGKILFEIKKTKIISIFMARKIFRLAASKLPIKTRFIVKD